MPELDLNYPAVFVAALAAFIGSSVWYMIFGRELATVSPAFAALRSRRPAPWRLLAVFGGSLVLAFTLALVLHLKRELDWVGAIEIGALLWLGMSAVQWLSSIVWENVPLKMAAIHGGDWLMKVVLICAILGAWR